MEWGGGVSSRFPCVTPVVERFYLDLPQAAKNRVCTLKWDVGVRLDHECVEFVTAGWYRLKFYDLIILWLYKVGESNEKSNLWGFASLACGDLAGTESWNLGN